MKQLKNKSRIFGVCALSLLLIGTMPRVTRADEPSSEQPASSETQQVSEKAPAQEPKVTVEGAQTLATDSDALEAYVEANQIKKGTEFKIRITIQNPMDQLLSSPKVSLLLPKNAPYQLKDKDPNVAISLAPGESVSLDFVAVANENLQKGTYDVALSMEQLRVGEEEPKSEPLVWKTTFALVANKTELTPAQREQLHKLMKAWEEGRVKIVEAGGEKPADPKQPEEPKKPEEMPNPELPTISGGSSGGEILGGSFGGSGGGSEGGEGSVKNKPKLIISNYQLEPAMAKAGENFTINLTFLNTNEEKSVNNIKITLNGGEQSATADGKQQQGSVFTPVNSSNTFYIGKISPQETATKQITLRVVPNAVAQSYTVKVDFEYEDGDGNQFTAQELIGVPVVQQAKILIGEIPPITASVGEPVSLDLDFYNTGKDTLSTFMVTLEGEGFEADEYRQFVGNFAPGASDRFSTMITATEPGKISGKLVFTYEDSTGAQQREERAFEGEVMEMGGIDGEGMVDPETGFPIDPETGMVIDPKTGMPLNQGSWWKNPILWCIVAALVILGTVLFLRRRKKKKEQQDLLIDIDEGQ
uniref:COG1361 S-layer family protein n=1 Tax=Ndongobacter massiliensis TaxID=1871025 RepID=UPI0009319295|nr:hypothetical protein [Ndongobacter massiliensis]